MSSVWILIKFNSKLPYLQYPSMEESFGQNRAVAVYIRGNSTELVAREPKKEPINLTETTSLPGLMGCASGVSV